MAIQEYYLRQNRDYYDRQLRHQQAALELRDNEDGLSAPIPHTIALAVNNACSLRCTHCDVGASNRDPDKRNFFFQRGTGGAKGLKEIPLAVLKRLVDQVAPHGPAIRPTFLEPMLRRDLFDLARHVKKRGLVFNLQTNGVLLRKRCQEVVDSGLDVIRVSLDGPPEIHDEIRGVPKTFAKVMEGLRKLVELKRGLGVKKPNIGLSYVISGRNHCHIVRFMDILEAEGLLDQVYVAFAFLRFVTPGEARAMQAIDFPFFHMTESSLDEYADRPVDPEGLIAELETLLARYPRDRYHYFFFPSELSRRDIHDWFGAEAFLHPEITCHVPWTHCQILYNGDVVFNGRCCSPSLGNILAQPFEEIWNGETAQAFRHTLLAHGNFPVCNRCCRHFDSGLLD